MGAAFFLASGGSAFDEGAVDACSGPRASGNAASAGVAGNPGSGYSGGLDWGWRGAGLRLWGLLGAAGLGAALGTLGTLLDSLLGATLQAREIASLMFQAKF